MDHSFQGRQTWCWSWTRTENDSSTRQGDGTSHRKALWQEAAGVTVGDTPEGNEEEEKGTHW